MSRYTIAVLLMLASMAAVAWAQTPAEFEPYVCYPLSGAQTVAIGDLNGDGRDDVAVAALMASLYVCYQLEDGTLAQPVVLPAPNYPAGLAVGDLDGDGRDDLVVGGISDSIFIYHQQPDGTLGVPSYGMSIGTVNGIALGDVNSDGLTDIVVSTVYSTSSFLLTMLQTPGGGFDFPTLQSISGFHVRSVSTLDYNSDGKTDVAAVVDHQVCYMLQNDSGGLDSPVYLPASWVYSLATGDVTGDGLDDIVFTIGSYVPDSVVGVYPQESNGGVGALLSCPAYNMPQTIALADFDGDQKNDVVTAHGSWNILSLFKQTDGRLAEYERIPAPPTNNYLCGSLAVGDLNSDGMPDVAIVDEFNGLTVFKHTSGTVDTIPPTCSAQLSGTQGLAGWYTSSVDVTVTAQDNAGPAGLQVFYTLDGTTWEPYETPVTLLGDGTTHFGCYAEDAAGNRSDTQWVDVKIDTQAPTSTVSISGSEGAAGWYVSQVETEVIADDGDGSGVGGVFYTLDGTNWLLSTGPVVISNEGSTRFGAYVEDTAGNRSATQWVDINIDTQAPVLTLMPSEIALWPANGSTVDLSVDAQGVDASSGVAKLHLKVIDEYGLVQPEMDVTSSPVIVSLVASRDKRDADGRVYTLVLTGTDAAGNTASVESSVLVPHGNPGKGNKPQKKVIRKP